MPDIALASKPAKRPARKSAQTPVLRTILKAATAAQHARLDTQLAGFDLHDLNGYRRFLEANATALLPLEVALVAAGVHDILPDWDRRARTDAILIDLAAVDGAARPLDPPVLANRAAALGTLYVLEGSRLGAAYLVKHVRRASDPRIVGATAYLAHGAGEHLWQTFLTVLESHANEVAYDGEIVRGARRTFEHFAAAAARS